MTCLGIVSLMSSYISAQTEVTYTGQIAPIIYKNCSPCHRQGEIAPFRMDTYEQVAAKSKQIQYVINKGLMPPWKADPHYCHYLNERILTRDEIAKINTWINNKCPRGNGKPAVPDIQKPDALSAPDMVVKFKKPYKIVGDNYDWFITYIQRITLPPNTWLRAIKIVPGNRKLVHHCRVDFDTTELFIPFADADGFASTNQLDNTRSTPAISFVGDYVPGISPLIYPGSMGFKLPERSYIMINVHYSPSSVVEYDQTEVQLFFYPAGQPPARRIEHVNYSAPKDVLHKIDHDSVETFAFATAPLAKDYSLISIQPHMHLFGQSIKIFATSPAGDTIRMCYIPDWDFYWQENYYLKRPVKLPAGSILHAVGVYDNTSKNPRNPDNPPKDVFFNRSMLTINEMFDFYLKVTEYQKGDENLDLGKK